MHGPPLPPAGHMQEECSALWNTKKNNDCVYSRILAIMLKGNEIHYTAPITLEQVHWLN